MTGEINRVPIGLLSLFDMKARGQNPRLLSEAVQAGLDIGRLILENERRLIRGTVSATAVGYAVFPQLTVPQGQLWVIHGFHVRSAALAAGTAINAGGVIQRVENASANTEALLIVPVAGFAAGQAVYLGQAFPDPYYARQGDVFGVAVSGLILGTAPTLIGLLDYTPLSV